MLLCMTKKSKSLIALGLLASIGAGVPLVERWIKCLKPVSEACVWAKAYMPLSFALWTGAALLAAVIAWHLLGCRQR